VLRTGLLIDPIGKLFVLDRPYYLVGIGATIIEIGATIVPTTICYRPMNWPGFSKSVPPYWPNEFALV
jgi:hypothetical protein